MSPSGGRDLSALLVFHSCPSQNQPLSRRTCLVSYSGRARVPAFVLAHPDLVGPNRDDLWDRYQGMQVVDSTPALRIFSLPSPFAQPRPRSLILPTLVYNAFLRPFPSPPSYYSTSSVPLPCPLASHLFSLTRLLPTTRASIPRMSLWRFFSPQQSR